MLVRFLLQVSGGGLLCFLLFAFLPRYSRSFHKYTNIFSFLLLLISHRTSYRYPKNNPNSKDIRSTTVWLRHYERYIEDQDVPVRVSDMVPDLPLVMSSAAPSLPPGAVVNLRSFLKRDRPLVIIAGSGS